MKFLIDMNLSPGWIDVLTAEGWEAVHWSTVGAHGATDEFIMTWAREHVYEANLTQIMEAWHEHCG